MSRKKKAPSTGELMDIAKLGEEMPAWKLAGICTMKNWAEGKKVTKAEFDAAVAAFESRRMGGGTK